MSKTNQVRISMEILKQIDLIVDREHSSSGFKFNRQIVIEKMLKDKIREYCHDNDVEIDNE